MSKIQWDKPGEKLYETGVSKGVLFVMGDTGTYSKGHAWNGLTGFTESPSGAEAKPMYANDKKYITLISPEELGATIEAFMYPSAFAECDGSVEVAPGVMVGQQNRKMFGFTYQTIIGNDVLKNDYGYKIHLVYGCMASPSERANGTVNEDTEGMTFSWTVTTTPIEVPGLKPAASIVIDSTVVSAEQLNRLENIIYGSEEEDARLPLPAEVIQIFGGAG